MKKTILAGSIALCLFAVLSLPAFAKPGEGQGQGQGAAEPEYFGQEQEGGHCGAMAADEGAKGGCGCAHHDAAATEPGDAGKACGCGPDCKCGCADGGECKCHGGEGCKCGAMQGEGCKCGGEGGCKCGGDEGCKCGGEGGCKCGGDEGCKCGAMQGGEHQGCGMMGEGHKGCGCGRDMDDDGPGMGHHKGHKKDHKFWKCPKARAELALTDEQVRKLEDMDAAAGAKMDAIHADMKGMKDEMKKLLDADTIDVEAIRALARRMADKKSEKMVIHLVMRAEAMNVLTAEQRGKMKELHAKMKDMKGPGDDDAALTDPKAMEEKAAALESEAKELDKESKALKSHARDLKAKAKKAKGGKGKGKK